MGSLQGKACAFASGWTFHADLRDDAGLVLERVRHAEHSFASDLRIAAVHVFPAGPDAGGYYTAFRYVLGSPACPSVDGVMTLEVPSTKPLLRPYSPAQQLSASFAAAPTGPAGTSIALKQTYVFTDYNKSPTHEPGGLIDAARLYPLLRFEYHRAPKDRNPPEWIRVDYRFDISLDGATWDASGASPNLVGVFADDDGFNTQISSIFSRGYKPVPVEMVGSGLLDGHPTFATFDNIHQWAKARTLPPTPGAANAAHSHWRWGAISTSLLGAPHFAGLGGPGGPMLDPAIPKQSLDFALTGRTPQPAVADWSTGPTTPSRAHFSELFTTGRAEPAELSGGSTVTQWWSLVANRSPEAARQAPDWSGTFFVHGFFFAHGPEQIPGLISRAGSLTDSLEKPPLTPRSRKSWFKP